MVSDFTHRVKLTRSSRSLNPCCNGRWSLTRSSGRGCHFFLGLNPCCNGRWSLTKLGLNYRDLSLNPCCNGRWSLTDSWLRKKNVCVLILVVMEDGLWQAFVVCNKLGLVLILVVMEDGLWLSYNFQNGVSESLNPCCNGRWSLTLARAIPSASSSLNPCCNGRWSLTQLGSLPVLEKS